jgi:SAM-dependent methyltransferase
MCARSIFDPLVDFYDAARPTYPDRLFADLERLTGPLAGAAVVDVGAGTGIATRQLVARGADVIAVELGEAMARRLAARTPGVFAVVRGDGEALPIASGVADLVCYAQAWHWMDVPVAAAEAARVLAPGGSLAVWWNEVDAPEARWWRSQQARLEAMSPGYDRGYRARPWADELRWTGRFADVVTLTGRWERVVDVETYLTLLRSKSYVAAIGDRLGDFLASERDSLLHAFPAGEVVEPFRTVLVVARLPREQFAGGSGDHFG